MRPRTNQQPSVADIKLHDSERLSIFIPMSKDKDRNNRLVLVNRQSQEEINIPLKKKDVNSDTWLLYGVLDYSIRKEILLEGKYWDLYLQNSEGTQRVNSTDNSIEFARINLDGVTFHPYITKKGNVSFRHSEIELFAGITDIDLQNDGALNIEGLIEKVDSDKVRESNLIITDTSNNENRIPVQIIEKPRENFDVFKTQFKLNETYSGVLPNSLKFALGVEVTDKESVLVRESPRLKYHGPATFEQDHLIYDEKTKIKFTIKPTKKRRYLSVKILEDNPIKETIEKVELKVAKIRRGKRALKIYKSIFRFASILPRKNNLVVFESFHGKQYSDSPRAIYEYMKEYEPNYNLIWSADRRFYMELKEKGLPVIRRFSIQWLLVMTRAKYWVTNTRLPNWMPKPKGTEYLQTWHGTPLKRLATDMDEVHMPGTNTFKYKSNFIKETGKWDYLVAPNQYSSDIFERAFLFNGTMIESGYPRNDYLIQQDNKETMNGLKKSLNIPIDKKVILYAPTWRDNQFYQKGKYKFDLSLDLKQMREELGEEYVVILRMHYLIAENFDLGPFEGFAYDLSKHEDIRDLYLISDALITDYSSVFFDYANLRRPIIFYVYDLDEYRDSLRGFYLDLETEAPGPLTKTTNEVITSIKEFENSNYHLGEAFEEFYDRFCSWEDGESSKRVVEEVFKK
ncbi:CDP-glycerol glycerophosphotransferase family protein [Halobacillus shinanisalinarum]|uniref:CDP-glycerol glycerophosphotransferase family protein n=1 Tax=Halobacillus shinanisalinarum TaxID=2932258 RepID=A0ABY4H1V3_9BACI|nr:CDP-glycerol glycerophosphotransferase family protein [Halobacillus shinanisalinarum]UOQ94421.1 CDP-glycerol glycerophosphotransferase family protein [Halobacillus shinanisalinarum]